MKISFTYLVKYLWPALLLFCCCAQKSKLTIHDLKFPDPERKAIAKHLVKDLSGFDTAWNRSYKQTTYFSQVRASVSYDSLLTLGSEVNRYNVSGNRVYYRLHSNDGLCDHWAINSNFVFDSLGLPVYAYGYHHDSMHYKFDPSLRTLLQIHNITAEDNKKYRDTVIFVFDTAGRLMTTTQRRYQNGKDSTQYFFDTNGMLIGEETHFAKNTNFAYKVSKYYYYRKDLLDSVIEEYHFLQHPVEDYTNRFYYDTNGIKQRSILYEAPSGKYSFMRRRELFYLYNTY